MRTSTFLRTLFDACYVINLDRRPDRWSHISADLQKRRLGRFLKPGVSPTRVSGVDGSTLDVAALHAAGVLTEEGYRRFVQPIAQKLFGMDLTPGAIGCALSHRLVWEKVVASRQTAALILEDDAELSPRFHRQLGPLWERVPKDWGIVYLGGLDLLAEGKPPRPYVAEGVRRAYQGHRELTAYVVNEASARRCLELSLPLTWQIDTHITSELKNEDASKDAYIVDPMSYVFQPALSIQITSLGTDVQKKPSDHPALEDAARRMREFVEGGTSVR
ncbi:unnamed protein product [Phytomonas sp. Hart1]|nr:unnamed protein product [Phytomonas sp. Hart1]|eukprot:CCW66797.1 unnamed protein product [Phytomonas sp. isolate Hart1]